MNVIHKYLIPNVGMNAIMMPYPDKVLMVGCDPENNWAIWIECSENGRKDKYHVIVRFTGEKSDYGHHLGSWVDKEQGLVLHAYSPNL